MRQELPTVDSVLQEMKQSLNALENVKLIYPTDLAILGEKRELRKRIADMEREADVHSAHVRAMAAD